MLRITVSFKQTTKDIKLYKTVKKQEEQSEFVKKAIDFYIKYLDNMDKNDKK
ncbi:hypothetical protein NRP93_003577 [Clostridium botulinum]|nr:hypothetical protein [Clostridium botulinum]